MFLANLQHSKKRREHPRMDKIKLRNYKYLGLILNEKLA
jgi:hypothetical protein